MIDKPRYRELLKKYLEGNIDSGELNELFRMSADVNSEELLAGMIDADNNSGQLSGADLPATMSEEILNKILASEKSTNRLFIRSKRKRWVHTLSVAAIFLIIVMGAAFLYFKPLREKSLVNFEAFIPANSIKKTNSSSRPLLLVLEDGSTVTLEPNSTLSFPEHFAIAKREVYMTGEAFFVITKNPNAPFFVFYNNIVTRVLGTSFTIKTNRSTKNVEVSVVTGKVQVIENKRMTSGNTYAEKGKSVIIIPNQKAMYNAQRGDFETTLADTMHPLQAYPEIRNYAKNDAGADSFYFQKATNVKQVFSQLEAIYGVEIIVDNENMYNCVFTGDISKQDMWKKLNIICLTIGATYEVKGTRILVSGNGCN